MKTAIYALSEPNAGPIRYIGKTIDLRTRLSHHLADARGGKRRVPVCLWIRKLLKGKREPTLTILEECEGDGAAEERFHIVLARRDGLFLLNLTDGGEGCFGYRHSLESRAKMSAQRKGVPKSQEFKERVSAVLTGRKMPRSAVEKSAAARRGRPLSPEQRARLIALHVGRKQSPAERAKRSEILRHRIITSETRAKLSALLKGRKFTAETIHRMSVAAKNRPIPVGFVDHIGRVREPDMIARQRRAVLAKGMIMTPPEEAKALADYLAGVPIKEISRRFNRSAGTIYNLLKRHHQKPLRRSL